MVVKDPWDLKDSPLTWHNDGSKTYDTTWGNNAAAQANPTGATCDTCYTDDYRPESTTFDFEYDYSPSMTDPTTYCKYATTILRVPCHLLWAVSQDESTALVTPTGR